MDMNRLINMGIRMLMNKGMNAAANRGKRADAMSPQEREQAKSARETAGKAQKGLRAARRFMR